MRAGFLRSSTQSEEKSGRYAPAYMTPYGDAMRFAVGGKGVVDFRAGIARYAGVDKKPAYVDSDAARQSYVRIVELYFQQRRCIALFAVRYAERHAAEQSYGACVYTYLQRYFDAIGVYFDIALRVALSIMIAECVARAAEFELGLQVKVSRDVQTAYECGFEADAVAAVRDGAACELDARRRVVCQIGTDADADLEALGIGDGAEARCQQQRENYLFHNGRILLFRQRATSVPSEYVAKGTFRNISDGE